MTKKVEMTEISKLIMEIYSRLGIKKGQGLLVQNIFNRVDLEHQEDTAYGLIDLKDQGLLEIKGENERFFLLTQKGRDYILDQRKTMEKEDLYSKNDGVSRKTLHEEDILEIKPNFFGLGLNLNAWFKKQFKREKNE